MKNTQYEIKEFPSSRQSTFDVGYLGARRHHIKALIELDVTNARKLIKTYRRDKRAKLSFNTWLLTCISRAIADHKEVHALRKGKNKLIIFRDIDISLIVEKNVNGQKVPLPLVIRNADKKSLTEIEQEIGAAKDQAVRSEKDYVLGEGRYTWAMKLFVALPQFMRLLVWNWVLKNPFFFKNMAGTAVVTSVSSQVRNVKGWGIPVTFHPVCFVVGSIVKKPGVVDHDIKIREYLYMTVLLDHDVIDGAPAARFLSRLTDLVESGYGL